MSAGYGRGYYGEEQLARPPARKGGWIKYVVIAGVGVAAWYLWPRKPKYDPMQGLLPAPPQQQQPQLQQGAATLVLVPTSVTQLPPPAALEQISRDRGYATPQAYEQAVIDTSRDLQQQGAKVELAPHLQHLTPRIG